MKKYRLVKKTYASGMVVWQVEKKMLWWWDYLDSYSDEEKARKVLTLLVNGTPYIQRDVIMTVDQEGRTL
jgi:hypothetical protein